MRLTAIKDFYWPIATHYFTPLCGEYKNREEFLEEVVDAFNYFFSLLVLTGVDSDELFSAYEKKDKIIRDRIDSGY